MSDYDVERKKWDEKSQKLLQKNGVNWKLHETYDAVFKNRNVLYPAYGFFDNIGAPGTVVLDYGCGGGWSAMLLATKASQVKAFDISEGRIDVVNRRIRENKITNIEAQVGNGEHPPYDDAIFDYIFGNAILHHIPLNRCLPEIFRILKPGGKAAFCEPFAHNPLINFFRFVKHHFVEAHIGTDKPLKYSDIPVFEKYFSKTRFVESSLFRDRFSALEKIDKKLLQVKALRRYVAYVTILLEKD